MDYDAVYSSTVRIPVVLLGRHGKAVAVLCIRDLRLPVGPCSMCAVYSSDSDSTKGTLSSQCMESRVPTCYAFGTEEE